MTGSEEQRNNRIRKGKRSRGKKGKLGVASVIAILVFEFALVSGVAWLSRSGQESGTVSSFFMTLRSMDARDAGDAVAAINDLDASRRASVAASEEESRSIEAMEQSLAQEAYESSVAEASRAAEWTALNAPLAGSHLTALSVTYNCDDTDIPYLRALFSHCIVIGNSRAKNAVDCGIMSENEVKYMSGVSVEEITPYALSIAYMYYPKTLFIMGLNDIGYYDGSNQRFYEDYLAMVKNYQAINPYGQVYLMEILPCPEEAREFFYRFYMIPDFNARIKQVCAETGAIYVSATDYADFKYINSADHAHYGKDFYYLWAQTIATQMHLWEDLAGLGYDIE